LALRVIDLEALLRALRQPVPIKAKKPQLAQLVEQALLELFDPDAIAKAAANKASKAAEQERAAAYKAAQDPTIDSDFERESYVQTDDEDAFVRIPMAAAAGSSNDHMKSKPLDLFAIAAQRRTLAAMMPGVIIDGDIPDPVFNSRIFIPIYFDLFLKNPLGKDFFKTNQNR
jgi:hypothetical protein